MALLDIIIDVLKINCSVVQCTGYASDIEALFYLLFFPSVFIILFVYIVSGAIINRTDGKPGALRILVSLALYAFIVFEGYYNLFVSLSRLWWLLLATLVGLWLFIRQFIHGGGSGGGGYSGFKGGVAKGLPNFVSGKVKGKLEDREKKKVIQIEQEMSNLRGHVNLMEKEINNPSPGTNMTTMINTYNYQKKAILGYIDELADMGKVNVGGVNWDLEKKDKKYMEELKELDKKVEEISHKLRK